MKLIKVWKWNNVDSGEACEIKEYQRDDGTTFFAVGDYKAVSFFDTLMAACDFISANPTEEQREIAVLNREINALGMMILCAIVCGDIPFARESGERRQRLQQRLATVGGAV